MARAADEQYLLQQVIQRDEAAFRALYTRYAPQVRRYLSQRIYRQELIDDALQEVMIVLWQRAADISPTAPLGAWLCGVARFKSYQILAKDSPTPTAIETNRETDAENPELGLIRREYGGVLSRAFDILPPAERTTMTSLLQGASYRDIAIATATPESTIRTRVARACQRLKTRLAASELRPT